jgi:hypothetical protein
MPLDEEAVSSVDYLGEEKEYLIERTAQAAYYG